MEIDKYFSSKFREAEMKPSEKAKMAFLTKLENTKKPIIWGFSSKYWMFTASAAMLALVFWTGINYKDFFPEKNQKVMVQKTSIDQPKKNTALAMQRVGLKNEIAVNQSNVPNKAQTKLQPKTKKIQNQNVGEIQQKMSIEAANNGDISQNKNVSVAKQKENVDVDDEMLVVLTPLETTEVSQNDFNAVTKNSISANNENKPMINRLAGRILKGNVLKSLKTSELFALQEDGFISSEARQVKDRISWIKSRLNN